VNVTDRGLDDHNVPLNTAENDNLKTSDFTGVFARVIADEAHKLKNTTSHNHNVIDGLHAPYMWFLTATPMINRVDDLLGYLWLLWDQVWMRDVHGKYMGDLPQCYTEEYHRYFKRDHERDYGTDFPLGFENHRLYLLNPWWYKNLCGRTAGLSGNDARDVLGAILRMIQVKVTPAMKMMVNGEEIRVGASIKPCKTVSVELGSNKIEQRMHDREWGKYGHVLSKPMSGGGGMSADTR
jgi:hypothetical protein